jgi:hypothetical protein
MLDALDTATSGIRSPPRLAIDGVLESEGSGNSVARKALSTIDEEKSVGPMEVDSGFMQVNQMGRSPERGEPIEFSAADEQGEHVNQGDFIPEGEQPAQPREVDDQAEETTSKMEPARAPQVAPGDGADHRGKKSRKLAPASNRQ